jgi:vesicle-fusing ATPase
LKVKELVFVAEPHPRIDKGHIALNKIQRQSAHVSASELLDCEIFQVPQDSFLLNTVTFECKFLTPNAALEPEIDATKFIDHLKQLYESHVFHMDQTFVTEYEGNMILVKIVGMEILSSDLLNEDGASTIKESPSLGQFGAKTEVLLTKSKYSIILFKNMPASRPTNTLFNQKFTFEKLGIGGLDAQLNNIFRRAFASRIFPPDVIKKLGIKHVKGIILYGPPGTGKTLVARQIGKVLNTVEPKIVNGPEVLNKYVGQSEENIRKLFEDAEAEYREKGDNSELHLIIFDELDAICKQRGTTQGGTGVNDSVVNQLLSKIDGVNALNNLLIIGMTNRLDLIEEALLRPGRFEVQMEIGLPDEKGRVQILRIHTSSMRENNYLADDVDLEELAEKTKNYSGAELEGVVKSAASFALNRQISDIHNLQKTIDYSKLKITKADFEQALIEVKPAFGVSTNEMESYLAQTLINYGKKFVQMMNTCKSFIHQVETSQRTNSLSVLLEGDVGSGKTTLATHLAVLSGFPYVKIISAEKMVGYSETSICNSISKIFLDAYKSPLSIIVLDNIERLIQYVKVGPRFSNTILQALLVLIKKPPPTDKKLMIIGTTSMRSVLNGLEVVDAFNVVLNVPNLTSKEEIRNVLVASGTFESEKVLDRIVKICPDEIGIKKLLLVTEMAAARIDMEEEEDSLNQEEAAKVPKKISYDRFMRSLFDCGVALSSADDSFE